MLWCVVVGALICRTSSACSVPVFRYGLEHWAADPYRVLVVHREGLSPEAQALVQELRDAGTRANLSMHVADLANDPDPQAQAAWKAAGSPGAPWLVALAPTSARVPDPVWSGPLNKANVSALIDSPARKSIAERFAEGESAVWILLESGDKSADDAAAKLIEARLTYLGNVMELPKLDEQDIRNGLVSLPPDGLRLAFSLVRVSRADPAEAIFTQMLLATEPDLKQTTGPIAFPVFGRGRALYALVDKGIKHETIDEAASFLIGSCSCQVKEKNPGADLLMAVDWKALMKEQATGLKDLPAVSDIVSKMPETVKIISTNPDRPAVAPSPSSDREKLTWLAVVWVLAAIVTAIMIWQGKRLSA